MDKALEELIRQGGFAIFSAVLLLILRGVASDFRTIVENNTVALTRCTDAVRKMNDDTNGRLDRLETIRCPNSGRTHREMEQ